MLIKKKIKYLIILIMLVVLPLNAFAAMQSNSYVIYENVNHVFDGPVISNVSHSVSGQSVTVTWDTSVTANAFVEYDTDSGFTNSREQGISAKSGTSQSVVATGLTANTLYYYRVKSERVNGGATIYTPSSNSFTTGSDTPPSDPDPDPGGGGGILIIDKTDKVPPLITDVEVNALTTNSIEINWITDEEATSFVEYGLTVGYGSTYGEWSSTTDHTVILENLLEDEQYHFRVLSSDDWGNLSYSDDSAFNISVGELEPEEIEPDEEPGTDDGIITETARKAIELFNKLFPGISLDNLDENNINSVDDLTGAISAPNFSGEPEVEAGATEAIIRWTTNIESNSLVALASESRYEPDENEPYLQVTGNFEEKITEHEVTIYGLSPDTVYHFQLRSSANPGPIGASQDYQFRTSIEELSITSFTSQVIDNETAIFKWVTNKEADSSIKFAPYHGNILAIDQAKIIKENAYSVIHEIEVSEFIAGTYYDVEFVSVDDKGNEATEVLSHFSTTEDDFPPEVSHIKADSTVFVDRGNKIQTIISWLTNEPSTSRVYFQEGVHGGNTELSESTNLNTNYTKEHVMVITKFKPGIVYSFRAESIDSGGNTTLSKSHTFMTAKKKDSIIQVIMKILEDTFGWLKKIM